MLLLDLSVSNEFVWVSGYDQLYRPTSPKLLLVLDLGSGCDKTRQIIQLVTTVI